MKNKKLIIFLIVLIAILILIINIFSKMINSNNGEQEKNQYKDEQLSIKYEISGKYEPSVINAEYSRLTQANVDTLDNIIDDIVDCINNKKYSKLYSMMNLDYKYLRFDDLQKFTKFFDEKYQAVDYKCVSFRLENSVCYIKIESSTQSGDENLDEIQIRNYKDIDEFKIYFEDIQQIEEAEVSFNVSNLKIRSKNILKYADKISINLEISNPTNNEEEITFAEYGLVIIIAGQEHSINATSNEKIKIPANETIQTELYINKEKELIFSPRYMVFKINLDGKEYEIESQIKHEEED